jgi:hypothetical protein
MEVFENAIAVVYALGGALHPPLPPQHAYALDTLSTLLLSHGAYPPQVSSSQRLALHIPFHSQQNKPSRLGIRAY